GNGAACPWDFIKVFFALPMLLVGPATVLMGCSFPILQKLAQTDLDYVGRRVGILLAANIAGSTIGAFVTGWIFLAPPAATRATRGVMWVTGPRGQAPGVRVRRLRHRCRGARASQPESVGDTARFRLQ